MGPPPAARRLARGWVRLASALFPSFSPGLCFGRFFIDSKGLPGLVFALPRL